MLNQVFKVEKSSSRSFSILDPLSTTNNGSSSSTHSPLPSGTSTPIPNSASSTPIGRSRDTAHGNSDSDWNGYTKKTASRSLFTLSSSAATQYSRATSRAECRRVELFYAIKYLKAPVSGALVSHYLRLVISCLPRDDLHRFDLLLAN